MAECVKCGKKLKTSEENYRYIDKKEVCICDECLLKENAKEKIIESKNEKTTVVEDIKSEHTNDGKISLILGIIGIITIFIINIIPLAFGIVAIVFGIKARKVNDNYGTYGLILGVIGLIIGLVYLIAVIVYLYTSNLVGYP